MDFRHSQSVRFTNSQDLRHFSEISETRTFWISYKFGFQTFTVVWILNTFVKYLKSGHFRHLMYLKYEHTKVWISDIYHSWQFNKVNVQKQDARQFGFQTFLSASFARDDWVYKELCLVSSFTFLYNLNLTIPIFSKLKKLIMCYNTTW